MRWALIVCFLAVTTIAAGHDAAQPPPPAEGKCGHALRAELQWVYELGMGPQGLTWLRDGLEDTDLLHYHLELEINPTTQWIGGSNTLTVRSLINGLTTFQFRLDELLTITAVQIGGQPVSYTRLDEATLEVTLDRTYDAGEEFDLYVEYNGSPLSGGTFGSIEFRTRGGTAPEVWTLSEPWFAYTWFPVKEDNTDKSTGDLWITVSDDLVVASNGVLQGVDPVAGGKLRYRWETDYPTVDYLYCLGITNYDTFDATWTYPGGTMPLNFYIYPESNTANNREAWLKNLDMLTVFSDVYGLYPFVDEKYGMCQVGFGGGMEHQTMTSQGGFWESITSHELSHQWWGDMITCATWHDIWLNEGFATYSEAIWEQYKPGSSGEPALHAAMDSRRPFSVNGSVYCYDISSVSRIFSSSYSYRKAGWVLHMLRHVVGDQTFFDILAAYRGAFAYQSATTEEFQGICENVAGFDLDWFFDAWVYDIGAPEYGYATRQHEVNGDYYLELYVTQTQSGSYPAFTMPVDIGYSVGGSPQVSVVWNDERAEHLLAPVSGSFTGATLDPDEWILERGKSPITFVEGPPKIVETTPLPGSEIDPTTTALQVRFHKDVVTTAGHYTLVGDAGGPVSMNFAYNSQGYLTTLTPAAPLAPDTYTLTVLDQITDVASGKRLDGELDAPWQSGPLPSGDGLPGGDAVLTFQVYESVLTGDLNCDGLIDNEDIDPFVLAITNPAGYGTSWPGCRLMNADVNGDGLVDNEDIDPFVQLLTGP